MRLLTMVCIVALAAAGSVQANSRVTDVQYIKLNRCVGLATGAGQDASPFRTAISENRPGRQEATLGRAQNAKQSAQRQMQRATGETRERLIAELSQDCAAMIV